MHKIKANASARSNDTGHDTTEGLVVVRPDVDTMSRQGLPHFVGISEATAGASGISMNLVVIPPGAAAEPHLHVGHETAIYHLEGRVEVRFGPGLRQSVNCMAGDFVFIAPGVPHQPVNQSRSQAARVIVARTDANEQESVVSYRPHAERADLRPRL